MPADRGPPPRHGDLALTLVAVFAPRPRSASASRSELEPTSLLVSGTPSAHGQELADERFGDLLAVRRPPPRPRWRDRPAGARPGQGSAPRPRLTVVSPWDPRLGRRFRRPLRTPVRAPTRALLLLDYHLPLGVAMRDTVPELEATLDANVHPPRARGPVRLRHVSRALQYESLDATERAELIAAPLLLIVLLARLPLAGRGCDPARPRRTHRPRRPRRPRPARPR